MAILKPRHGLSRLRGCCYLLFFVVAGCMIADIFQPKEKPYKFSHKVHSSEQDLECTDCHRMAAGSDTPPGMPSQRQCQLCHDAIDAKKPPERRVATLFEGKDFKAAHLSRLDKEIAFSHQRHTAKEVACTACHEGIDTSEAVDERVAVTMDECSACHAQQKLAAGNECATCHTKIRAEVRPPTHDRAWDRVHGRVVRGHSEATADRCSLCHTEEGCTSCHRDTEPKSHNNYFRVRGHGVMARMDRDNCAACHRSDSCDRCHQETRPINHTGSWGGTQNNHCRTCHLPLRSDECATCHRGTPSHEQAPPKPPGHTAGMNCRQCHGVTIRLPHPDKGDDCNACHR